MFLKHQPIGDLVEVLTLESMYNPSHSEITGRYQAGQEAQDPETFLKSDLIFPSGESLPRCWIDPNYRDSKG